MYLNKITINFKSKSEPVIFFAKFNPEEGQSNNDLAKLFSDTLNSVDPVDVASKFMTFNLGIQNFIFNKSEILDIQIEVIEQVVEGEKAFDEATDEIVEESEEEKSE